MTRLDRLTHSNVAPRLQQRAAGDTECSVCVNCPHSELRVWACYSRPRLTGSTVVDTIQTAHLQKVLHEFTTVSHTLKFRPRQDALADHVFPLTLLLLVVA